MPARRIAVIGTGYVGLTTGACLASLGHHVVCADSDPHKVGRSGWPRSTSWNPDCPNSSRRLGSGRLRFVQDTARAVADADTVFLCLPTPMGAGGAADLAAVESVAAEIHAVLRAAVRW